MNWLAELTQPQATFASAIITFVGAIVAVLLGWLLFSQKVKDIRSAVTATDEIVRSHQSTVVQALADIEAKISGLAESAGQLRADLGDREAATGRAAPEEPEAEGAMAEAAGDERRDPALFPIVQSGWHAIRDYLEEVAADPNIDGRTAAKYQRIDRRNYSDLIESLARDGRLTSPAAYLEAVRIWSRYRTRRMAPTNADTTRITDIARSVH